MRDDVTLRDVSDDDVAVFFEHQREPEAVAMAAFPARPWAAHVEHWTKVRERDDAVLRTIVAGGEVAGNVVSWVDGGTRKIGYWVGSRFWGGGIATAAVTQLVELLSERPLHAHVAVHNVGSIRVLEKCGFAPVGRPVAGPDGVEEILMELL